MISVQQLERAGFYVRAFHPAKGEELPGHKHRFDHVTFLLRGSIELTCEGKTTVHSGIDFIFVPKENVHSIKALTDDTVWCCVFVWRDEFGKPTSEEHKKIPFGECIDCPVGC